MREACRWFRTSLGVLALSVAAGCGPTNPAPQDPPPTNRALDLLFVIDNSSGMSNAQAALTTNFPRFMDVLEALPNGLPDLHLAVVSTDMGAGTFTSCAGNGDAGRFQFAPQTPCTDTTLDGQTFFVNGEERVNYRGDIRSAFACVANLGSSGCGFEQPLFSLTRALGADGLPPPADNVGFLRPNAHLGIIILANEDDCSAQLGADSPLFDSSDASLGTLGPRGSFRCLEFGHVCDQGAPTHLATDPVTYTNCRSNERSPYLKSVAAFAAQIKALKANPGRDIDVAAIIGVPRGNPNAPISYEVTFGSSNPDNGGPQPQPSASCTATGGSVFADGPARLADFTRQFGDHGMLYSICEDDYGPAVQKIAESLSTDIAP